MKRKAIIAVPAALAVVTAMTWLLWQPGSAPQGQPPLTILTANGLGQFKQDFNQATDRPRLILLLSPT